MNKQRRYQDKRLGSGERQVRPTLEGIERWHKWRYEEAKKYFDEKDSVVDLGSGCGYGTFILAQKATRVVGIDDSEEAIEYANKYYKLDNIEFISGDLFNMKDLFDTTVAFEIIEHVKDIDKIFDLIRLITKKKIILSVPHVSIPVKVSKWHWRHFTEEDIGQQIERIGFNNEILKLVTFQRGLAVFCIAIKKKIMTSDTG